MEKVQRNMNIYNQLYTIHQDEKGSQLRVTFQSNMRVWEWEVGSETMHFHIQINQSKQFYIHANHLSFFYHIQQPLKQSLNLVFPSLALFYFQCSWWWLGKKIKKLFSPASLCLPKLNNWVANSCKSYYYFLRKTKPEGKAEVCFWCKLHYMLKCHINNCSTQQLLLHLLGVMQVMFFHWACVQHAPTWKEQGVHTSKICFSCCIKFWLNLFKNLVSTKDKIIQ